jgi:hypothetical protein
MSYALEWIPGACVVLVALLCAPPLVLIALGVLVLAALAALLALAGAIAATPYLLFRAVRRRWHRTTPATEPARRGLKPVHSKST